MKTAFIIFLILIVGFVILLYNAQKISRAVGASGLVDGMLSQCPDKPNCVCSEYIADTSHYITPLIIPKNNAVDTVTVLKNVIREMGGTIQVESRDYIAATFTSVIFKFVDDLELRIDSDKNIIHIRSASRVGHGDMGVNKKRTDLLKELYNNKSL